MKLRITMSVILQVYECEIGLTKKKTCSTSDLQLYSLKKVFTLRLHLPECMGAALKMIWKLQNRWCFFDF